MEKKKNAIWIICDQLRAHAIACNGDPNVRTPNIDRLSGTGVNFERAVGGYPICCPFRGSMLTGIYPHRCVPGHEYQMPPEQKTVAHAFREHGYHTAYIGKWHVDGFHESEGRAALHRIPKERRGGFDYWMGYENNNSQWDCYVHGGDEKTEIPPTRLEGYETDKLTDLFIEHIESLDEDTPFFSVLSVQPPHDPYVAPAEYMAHYTPATIKMRVNVPDIPSVMPQARRELAGAYAMIENLDYNVGRVVEWLHRTGRYEDTHILFFSDHGDMHGSHGMFRKTNPYEESIRVPFIISGCQPCYDGWHQGRVSSPINHVDIAPTTLGLCGIPVPEVMQGCDYSSLRCDKLHEGEFPDSAYLQEVIPTGHHWSIDRPWRGIVTTDGYKYVCLENTPWLLFDLNDDPLELCNLAFDSRFHAKREVLHSRLRQWIEDTEDTFSI